MSEETEKKKPAQDGAQKSGNNNRHRYNRHRPHHHKPNKPQGEPGANAEVQEEAKPTSPAPQKPQQHSQKPKTPKKEVGAAQEKPNHTRPESKTENSEVGENKHSSKRDSGNRRDNRGKPAFSSASTLLDTAPEDDFIFGKQSGAPQKVRTHTFTAEELDQVRRFTDEELFGTDHLIRPALTEECEPVEVVSVKFKKSSKTYYFSPEGHKFSVGDFAIVDTARGPEFGEIYEENHKVKGKSIIQPLRPVIRPATKEDIARNEQNKKREKEAFDICLQKIPAHKLDMKLVDVQISFDNSKILFYFTSAGRVDFRELVRDLASVFKTRIELRQIGIRDEAKMLGGIGICGRPLCCSRFLGNFAQVSIKMAKEQGLSLNSGKISGNCGRLMCCLNFENQTYLDEIKLTPMPGSIVKLDGQTGTVTEATPLIGMLKIHLHGSPDGETVTVHRDSISVIEKKSVDNEDSQASED